MSQAIPDINKTDWDAEAVGASSAATDVALGLGASDLGTHIHAKLNNPMKDCATRTALRARLGEVEPSARACTLRPLAKRVDVEHK